MQKKRKDYDIILGKSFSNRQLIITTKEKLLMRSGEKKPIKKQKNHGKQI